MAGNPDLGPDGKPIVGSEGQGNFESLGDFQTFRKAIPDLVADKSLDNVKDWPTVFKNYRHAQEYIGGAVKVPGKDAKPEEWNEFYGKVGRPGKPEEYQITKPALDQAVKWHEDQEKAFLARAHKVGMTSTQVQECLNFQAEWLNANAEKMHTEFVDTVKGLKKEWGGAYDRNIVLAQRAIVEWGGVEIRDILDQTGLGNHPAVVRMFVALGELLAEEGIISGEIPGIVGSEEAKAKIAQIMADKNDLYHAANAGKEGHKERVAEVQRLFELAYNPVSKT